jgi:hypothetical protein
MAEPFSTASAAASRQRAQTRALIGLGLGAFLLGAVATWLLAGSPGIPSLDLFTVKGEEQAAPADARPDPAPTSTEAAPATTAQAADLVQMAEQQGGLDQRVAAMEQRLARLDLQSQAAAGNAARAESLLVTFAARRSLERGVPLGYLADQLRLRFGDAQPNAVSTVIEVSRDPVTLDRLIARLDGLAPELGRAPPEEGVLSSLTRELSDLFVVRRENSPSPQPRRRLERARLFLESGRAAAAASEVRNLPNAPAAAEWIADAERYAAAQRALELLETTALLEPRSLRDGAGRSVEQLSPVAGD